MSYADLATDALRRQARLPGTSPAKLVGQLLAGGEAAITATLHTASDTVKTTTAADLQRFAIILAGVTAGGLALSIVGSALLSPPRRKRR